MNAGVVVKEIVFNDSNKFQYKFWSDDGGKDTGVGTYKLKKHRLYLFFENGDDSIKPSITADSAIIFRDSVTMKIEVFSAKTKEKLPWGYCEILDPNGNELISAPTDLSGQLILKVSKSVYPKLLRIQSVGYFTIEKELTRGYSYYIKANLSYGFNVKVMVFKIRKRTKNSFELKADYKGAKFEKYIKQP